MKKVIRTIIIFTIVFALVFPWKINNSDYSSIGIGTEVCSYKAIIWQYTYRCISQHNNYQITMEKRVLLLGFITLYEETDVMMLSPENELIPWEEPEFLTQIPAS